ncbi:putative acetyltransferase At3g50280 [Bidens hawaiensis]|uniref:putative acetyltransferase At3g50280 n=1 Tax=Bidens hawaiensis TaxID=980011 RepID=UPI00404930C3
MESPRVEMISNSFVKPKFISKEAKKPVYLSPWDLAMMSTHYIQKGLLYALPKNQDFSITAFLDDLKDSLSATLTHFHPLAARLSTVKQQNPPSFSVFIDPNNSPGARFIHSSVNLTVADILTPTDVPLVVQSFFDHHKAISHEGHELSLLSVQVTELVDGIFIGCSVNHMVADGSSFWHFFNSWSEVFRSNTISRPPVIKRWVPPGSDPIITLPFTREDQFIERPSPSCLRVRNFHFSSDSLVKLKAKANSECNTTKISTLQSLTALVWRCMTRARRLLPDQETSCRMAADNRKRLSPPLPETYFGTSLHSVKATATTGQLLDQSVGWAAWRLHQAVVNHDDKVIREFVNSWLKRPFVYTMSRYFDASCVHIGGSPRFDMYGNKFRLGKGLAVLSGYANKFDGKVTVYPGREGGGSIDLEICMLSKNMEAFESDMEFMSVVNEEDNKLRIF